MTPDNSPGPNAGSNAPASAAKPAPDFKVTGPRATDAKAIAEKATENKTEAAKPDSHESAVHFLLRNVMHTGDGVASAEAQRHLEAIHEEKPTADMESYEDKVLKAQEKGADDAAALAAAQKEKDEEDLAKAQDKEKAAKNKHRQELEAASAKK